MSDICSPAHLQTSLQADLDNQTSARAQRISWNFLDTYNYTHLSNTLIDHVQRLRLNPAPRATAHISPSQQGPSLFLVSLHRTSHPERNETQPDRLRMRKPILLQHGALLHAIMLDTPSRQQLDPHPLQLGCLGPQRIHDLGEHLQSLLYGIACPVVC